MPNTSGPKLSLNKNLKATWASALLTFFAPFFLAFIFRWIVFEPYVIPSGSMIPTLLVHDHILVNKWVYGWRWPFSEKWLYFWSQPRPGEIVVFKYPQSKDTYFVKRIAAVGGDEIEVHDGQIIRNGVLVPRTPVDKEVEAESGSDSLSEFQYFQEKVGDQAYLSRSKLLYQLADQPKIRIPDGHFFVVGDNRDESSDSRSWGFVPYSNLMGRAWFIWLSCTDTLPASPMLCDPNTLRWSRFFKKI